MKAKIGTVVEQRLAIQLELDVAKRHPEERDVPEYTFGNNG